MSSHKLFNFAVSNYIAVKKAAEIGVLSYEKSNIKRFIDAGVVADLYEAHPMFAKNIRLEIERLNNVTLIEVAVSDSNGEMKLANAGPSTFDASQTISPAINHDHFDMHNASFEVVKKRDFSELDPGDYDLVSIDVEGGEWPILSKMKSRPSIIAIETNSRDYINPYIGSITDWLFRNDYKIALTDDTDTIFIKNTITVNISVVEKIRVLMRRLFLFSGRI